MALYLSWSPHWTLTFIRPPGYASATFIPQEYVVDILPVLDEENCASVGQCHASLLQRISSRSTLELFCCGTFGSDATSVPHRLSW